VTARARVEAVDERSITFSVEAHDGIDRIGTGTHSRAAVDVARFERHIAAKQLAAD
jgi:fluoroacetyl-CoA thioesterase